MKVLLLGKGNIPSRYSLVSINCENWIDRKMGDNEFVTFGYNEGVDILIKVDDDFNQVIKKLPDGWTPDICLLWEVDWNLLPRGIENAPFPTVTIAWDWDYDVSFSRAIFDSTDIIIALGKFEEEAIRSIGGENVALYYFIGVMEEFFSDQPKKIKDRKYDILYTTWIDDVVLSDRSEWILKLCSLSDKYNICIDNPVPGYRDYNALLRDTKLVISHHRYGSMSGRVLEAGAQGTVVLETGDEIESHFQPNKDYVPLGRNNLINQIQKCLGNEQALQDMSDSMHTKVTRDYEARNRFEGLLKFSADMLKGKKSKRRLNKLKESEKCSKRGEIFYYSYFRTPEYILKGRREILEQSIVEFEKSVALDPTARAMTNLAVATSTLGFIFNKRRTMEEKGMKAVSILKEALKLFPNYTVAYFQMGIIQLRVKHFKEAFESFSIAKKNIRNDKSSIDPWCLYSVDFEEFPMRKTINKNLQLLCNGEDDTVKNNLSDLYLAAIGYYISKIEEERGFILNAYNVIQESYKIYPDSHLIVKEAAELSSILGYREESLKMYKEAINLLPFNIDFRVKYINLLYLYHRDNEAVDAVNEIIKIIRAVRSLRNKFAKLQDTTGSLVRLTKEDNYVYDSSQERTVNSWVEELYVCLRKDPGNVKVLSRIVQLWLEIGRVDKAIDVISEYSRIYLKKDEAEELTLASLREMIKNVKETHEKRKSANFKKLHLLKESIELIKGKECSHVS